jgi:molybdate transport system ATP-binding protein
MTCRLAGGAQLEVPLARMDAGARCRIAVRAGDILLARSRPEGLSARNLLPGRVVAVEQQASTVVARISAGPEFEVHITPAARQALGVVAGAELWLVIKTFSCHVVAPINVG